MNVPDIIYPAFVAIGAGYYLYRGAEFHRETKRLGRTRRALEDAKASLQTEQQEAESVLAFFQAQEPNRPAGAPDAPMLCGGCGKSCSRAEFDACLDLGNNCPNFIEFELTTKTEASI